MVEKLSTIQSSKKNFDFVDNVKFFACLSVVAVHFRANYMLGLPKEAIGLKAKVFFSIDYQLFITCVPLFMIATGFLMLNKTFSKAYFKKMFQVILLYVICSLFTFLINHFVFHRPYTPIQIFNGILNFNLVGYAWYVEMYLGLLFFIPLLNVIIKNSSIKQLRCFILALLIAVALPSFVNNVPELNAYFHLPNAFGATYPFLYYFIGAYFRVSTQNRKKNYGLISTLLAGLMIILGIAINLTHANPYVGGTEGGYASLLVVVQATCVFYLFQIFAKKSNFIIHKIARLTLPIYLMSYVVDINSYPHFIKPFISTTYIITIFFALVISHFLISQIARTNLPLLKNSENRMLSVI